MLAFSVSSLLFISSSLVSLGRFSNVFGGMKAIEMLLTSNCSNWLKSLHIWGLMYLIGLDSRSRIARLSSPSHMSPLMCWMPLLPRERDLTLMPSHMWWFSCEILFSLSERYFSLVRWRKVPAAISDSLQSSNCKITTEANPWNMSALMVIRLVLDRRNFLSFGSSLNEPASILWMGFPDMYRFVTSGRSVNIFLSTNLMSFLWMVRPAKEGRVDQPPGSMCLILFSSRKRCSRETRPSHISALTCTNWFSFSTKTLQFSSSAKAPGLMSLMLLCCRYTVVASAGMSGTSWRSWYALSTKTADVPSTKAAAINTTSETQFAHWVSLYLQNDACKSATIHVQNKIAKLNRNQPMACIPQWRMIIVQDLVQMNFILDILDHKAGETEPATAGDPSCLCLWTWGSLNLQSEPSFWNHLQRVAIFIVSAVWRHSVRVPQTYSSSSSYLVVSAFGTYIESEQHHWDQLSHNCWHESGSKEIGLLKLVNCCHFHNASEIMNHVWCGRIVQFANFIAVHISQNVLPDGKQEKQC